MLLWLWKNLRGYVTVQVTGAAVERFLNMAAYKGIYMWDVIRDKGRCELKVSARAFFLLKDCRRKTGCKVKIVEKTGWPFFARRYRKRKPLLGGLLFFALALTVLSCFVWRVDVSGCKRLGADQVTAVCAELGLEAGSLKFGLNVRDLEKGILDAFPEISWVNVHVAGTRAEIKVAETDLKPKIELIDSSAPCDIVAAKDGLITGIVTAAGKPLRKENDTVRKGDVIVSGEISADGGDGGILRKEVHASAEVWARTYYTLEFDVPYEYEERQYTGRTKKSHEYLIFNSKFNGIGAGIPFANCDKITSRAQLRFGEDYPLPFIMITNTYKEFTTRPAARSRKDAEELAARLVTGRIIREFDFGADIVDKRLTFEEKDGRLGVSAIIVVNERIDEARPRGGGTEGTDGTTQDTD